MDYIGLDYIGLCWIILDYAGRYGHVTSKYFVRNKLGDQSKMLYVSMLILIPMVATGVIFELVSRKEIDVKMSAYIHV